MIANTYQSLNWSSRKDYRYLSYPTPPPTIHQLRIPSMLPTICPQSHFPFPLSILHWQGGKIFLTINDHLKTEGLWETNSLLPPSVHSSAGAGYSTHVFRHSSRGVGSLYIIAPLSIFRTDYVYDFFYLGVCFDPRIHTHACSYVCCKEGTFLAFRGCFFLNSRTARSARRTHFAPDQVPTFPFFTAVFIRKVVYMEKGARENKSAHKTKVQLQPKGLQPCQIVPVCCISMSSKWFGKTQKKCGEAKQ